MKIVKFGHVIITPTKTHIEGWLMSREDTDSVGATANELLAATAVEWALKKLQKEYDEALLAGLIKTGERLKAEQAEKGKPN